ncbi:DNA-processing protein DprA [Brevibacillus ruminantium]|uniref:DNA-processing protein DprA n=1 Tax=Brevibacillus ruminantium TaxID=2950604 RepID=A0ABY4WM21_9BACL|nr:DNA-processing protein DprA [Brevibacillus ruminantium]USG67914.1 DNA-processing protein DprA [Brevibacillus ruminantium]
MKDKNKRKREETKWFYALSCVPGLGRRKLRELYQMCGSFQEAGKKWAQMATKIGLTGPQIKRGEGMLTAESVEAQFHSLRQRGIGIVGCWEEEFPPLLQAIPDPPLALFYKGDLGLTRVPAIGVVGSRKPTPYGRAACRNLVKQLSAAGLVVVSGLAYGIDAEAHRETIKEGGATIGVLGCGIDIIYPPVHRDLYQEVAATGLLVSEYPPGTPPVPGLFPERNRIISGLGFGVLVVEAAEKSGSLVTADCALEQGREVFAVPGPIFSDVSAGPHNLIKQGAKLVTAVVDVLEELPSFQESDNSGHVQKGKHGGPELTILSEDEQMLIEHIGHEPVHLDEISEIVQDKGTVHLYRTLLNMESKQVITSLPGGYYVRR